MEILIKEVGKPFRTESVDKSTLNDLSWLQEKVGGFIECVHPIPNQAIMLVCNEEGKLMGLSPNLVIGGDIIAGDVVFCSYDEDGDSIGLTEEQIACIYDAVKSYRIIAIPPQPRT